jgi:hypothetical protein
VRQVRPWVRALRAERCLPASDRGPVECWEFARLIAARLIGSQGDGAIAVEAILSPGFGITHGWAGIGGGGAQVVEGRGKMERGTA